MLKLQWNKFSASDCDMSFLVMCFFTVSCSFDPVSYNVVEANTNQEVCIMCTGGTSNQDIEISVVTSDGSATGSSHFRMKGT